ncbi:MAG: DUF4910 domain-containing protein [Oscillospiraceae bacterium]|nr:DUF4910 domain-containing protein [Oscillospiraceae bacterium]
MQELLRKLYDGADIDFLMKETATLTDIEFKQTFREYKRAAEYTYGLLKREGIDAELLTFPADGKTTYQDLRTPLAWEATMGRLTVVKSEIPFDDPVVADYERHPFHLIKGSTAAPEGGIKARLLTEEQVLGGADANGAIILFPSDDVCRSPKISPMLDRGAIGFISSCVGRGMEKETPDCITWCNAATDDHAHWHVQSEDRPFLGFSISPRTADKLREALAKGEVELLAESDGRRYEGEINAVCGYVKGKSEKEIWLVAHLFEPFFTDNSLSVIVSIEIAKAIKKLGQPNFSLRLVFSAETYGLAAVWDHYKDTIRGKVLGALDIDGIPAYTFDKNFSTRFNPYCSPFFGNYLFLLCAEAFEKVFPGKERCLFARTEFGDDLILGDPTIGIPTIYYEEAECKHWHSSYWIPERIDPDKVRRSYSFAALWTATVAFLDEENVRKYLPGCVEIAKNKLLAFAKEDNSRPRMEYFLEGEKSLILDFLRAVDCPEIAKAADELSVTPTAEGAFSSPALDSAANIIPQRATEGFPFDLVRLPYEERRPLPNAMIYGAFATIVAKMDGRKNLRDIILEAVWENKLALGTDENVESSRHFRPLSDELINDYIDAIYYLADAGYLSIKEI